MHSRSAVSIPCHISTYNQRINIRALDDVVRSGKALYVAVSDTPAWVISAANNTAQLRGWRYFTFAVCHFLDSDVDGIPRTAPTLACRRGTICSTVRSSGSWAPWPRPTTSASSPGAPSPKASSPARYQPPPIIVLLVVSMEEALTSPNHITAQKGPTALRKQARALLGAPLY